MKARQLLKFAILLGGLVLPVGGMAGQEGPGASRMQARGMIWNAQMAEHLWNRAGFGASEAEIARSVAIGQKAFVDELLARVGANEEFLPDQVVGRKPSRRDRARGAIDPEARKEKRRDMRRNDREQALDFGRWWMGRMLDGRDPLGERMTLFWHGHFTSSMDDVRNSYAMIKQNELFRALGLGSFGELLRAVARDPAMLEYLDNKSNRKSSPNENFARELLELFTLGEGHYSEQDIKEAARAFTGWTERGGAFVFRERVHDFGTKTFMGQEGEFYGDDVLGIILQQQRCSEYLAGKLISYFEGRPPSPKRLASYAKYFRENDMHVGKFLLRLFMDKAFYREQVVGARIASPVDFMVGNARRLDLDAPPEFLLVAAGILGQRLFNPPNVKGWDGGTAWISSSTLIHRGNLSGVLLGEISMRDFLDYNPELDAEVMEMEAAHDMPAVESMADGAPKNDEGMKRKRPELGELKGLRMMRGTRWHPRLRLGAWLAEEGAKNDQEIVSRLCDRLLGVRVGPETRKELTARLQSEREALDLRPREFLHETLDAEPVLRALAHLILSLPEAQLN